jgi:hypothetical protein
MYLVDTNVISELRKSSQKIDENVTKWANSVSMEDLYLSIISIQEIKTGILNKTKKDKSQADKLNDWFKNDILKGFEGRILGIDIKIALKVAELHAGNPKPYADSLIAGTALHHDLVLVTRNVKDFKDCGLELINPWD